MKFLWTVLAVLILSLLLVAPAVAADPCSMDGMVMDATPASLIMHINHARQMGHIDNDGLAQSLVSQVNAAQAAYEAGNKVLAAQILRGTVNTVNAQAGVHIAADCAPNLAEHVQKLMQALKG